MSQHTHTPVTACACNSFNADCGVNRRYSINRARRSRFTEHLLHAPHTANRPWAALVLQPIAHSIGGAEHFVGGHARGLAERLLIRVRTEAIGEVEQPHVTATAVEHHSRVCVKVGAAQPAIRLVPRRVHNGAARKRGHNRGWRLLPTLPQNEG